MHIIHYNLTTTTKEGGVETFVWDLAGEQARRGDRVTVVGGAGPVRRNLPGVAARTVPFIDRGRFAIGPLRRAYAWRKLAERLSMLPAALPLLRDADLVHIHKPYDLVLAPLLKRRGVPVVYHGHGEDFFRGDRRLMRAVPVLLSCSSYNAATLRQHYGREATVVYNGVDTEHFQPRQAGAGLRSALAGDARYVVALPGRMMPWKGQALAIEALAALPDLSARLVIIGDGEARAALERQTHAAGVAGRIVFTGTVPHRRMPEYFAAADLVLGTSYASETFGMTLAEAQACARPVLASSWPGYDDVVLDGLTGERFASRDAADLAARMDALLADEPRRRRLGAAARQRVERLFTWRAIADHVGEAYRSIR